MLNIVYECLRSSLGASEEPNRGGNCPPFSFRLTESGNQGVQRTKRICHCSENRIDTVSPLRWKAHFGLAKQVFLGAGAHGRDAAGCLGGSEQA